MIKEERYKIQDTRYTFIRRAEPVMNQKLEHLIGGEVA